MVNTVLSQCDDLGDGVISKPEMMKTLVLYI